MTTIRTWAVPRSIVLCVLLCLGSNPAQGQSISAERARGECTGVEQEPPPRFFLTLDQAHYGPDLAVYVGAAPLDWPLAPRTSKRDVSFSGIAGDAALRLHKNDGESVRIERVQVENAQNAISLQRTGETYIYDLKFSNVMPRTIYASVIRVGMKGNKRTRGPTVVQRVFADGKDLPLTSYQESNTDFLTSGPGNSPVLIRDVTAHGFSDSVIDNKSIVYISNATFSNAHRILRAHSGAEIVIVNSIINSAEGRSLAWLGGKDSTIRYYNTLWNGNPAPDPSLILSLIHI